MKQKFTIAATILGLLAFHPQSFAQDLDKKVTFSSPAKTIRDLLPELSQVVGITLMFGQTTQNEVVAIDVADVPVKTLLDRIADVTGATWEDDSGGKRLTRSSAMAREQEKAENAARAAAIKKSIEKEATDVVKNPTLDEARAKELAKKAATSQQAFNAQVTGQLSGGTGGPVVFSMPPNVPNPTSRLLQRVLLAMDPMQLASGGPDSRVVFSDSPTPMQIALGINVQGLKTSYLQEHNTWVKANPARSATGDEAPADAAFGEARIVVRNGAQSEAEWPHRLDSLGKILLVSTRRPGGSGVGVELLISDPSGEIVGRAEVYLEGQLPKAEAPSSSSKSISMSDQAIEFAKIMRGSSGPAQAIDFGDSGGAMVTMTFISTSTGDVLTTPSDAGEAVPLSDAWLQKFLHPEKFDPLSFTVSEAFAKCAKAEQVNLVANLDDSLLEPLCRSVAAKSSMTTASLLKLASDEGSNVSLADGWLTIKPVFLPFSRATRANRPALAGLMSSLNAKGSLSLQDKAAYAAVRPLQPLNGIEPFYLGAINHEARSDFMMLAITNWRMLRFYGSLNVSQKQGLGTGRPVGMGLFSADQLKLISAMVYNDEQGPSIQPRNRRGGAGPESGQDPMSFSRDTTLASERTESLPNGINGNGAILLRSRNQEGVFASSTGKPAAKFFTASSYGAYLGMQSSGQGSSSSLKNRYDQFVPAYSSSYDFTFEFAPNISLRKQLRDFGATGKSKPITYDQLPDAFKATVRDWTARYAQGGNGGGAPPPPPPSH